MPYHERNKSNFSEVVSFEHLGVSGSNLSLGYYEKGSVRIPVIIKNSPGIYKQEIKGARLLNTHLPILWPLDYVDENTAIYAWIGKSPTLDDELTSSLTSEKRRQELLDMYLRMHVNMWDQTHTFSKAKVVGYPRKIEETKKAVLEKNFGINFLDTGYPLGIRLRRDNTGQGAFTEQMHEIRSVENALDWMSSGISDSLKLGGSLSHGDENFLNCLVRNTQQEGINYTDPLIMIDLNMAGYRSVFEPMTKILSWLRCTRTEQDAFRYGVSYDRVGYELLVNYRFDNRYEVLEDQIKSYFRGNVNSLKELDDNTFEKYFNAYQMMYFLREAVFYANRRGRSKVTPYLVGKALSFVPESES